MPRNTLTTSRRVAGTSEPGELAPPFQIIHPDGSCEAELEPNLPLDTLLSMYRWLLLTRELDTRLLNLQRQGRIGFMVPCTGEEAVQIGSALALRKGDWCFSQYREPGSALARGMPLARLLGHMYGNSLDPLQGRQMPSHFGWREARFVPATSPVATQIPIAMGCAWASKLKGDSEVTLVYFGEGATSEGDFHAACNMAGVFKIPVVFFCKNNQYAISTPMARQTAAETIAQKAVAYGFDGVRVDGNDLLAVYVVTRDAVEKARSGMGPTLIEAVTYRRGPHSTADDPRRYREENEVAAAAQRDPIDRFRLYLNRKAASSSSAPENVLWSEDVDKSFREQVGREVEEAITEAEKQGPPPVESVFEDVYADMPWHVREQMERALPDRSRAHSESPTWGQEDEDYRFP